MSALPPPKCPLRSTSSSCRCRLGDLQLLEHVFDGMAVVLGTSNVDVVLPFMKRTVGVDPAKHRRRFVRQCVAEAASRNRGGGWHTHRARTGAKPLSAPNSHSVRSS